MSEPTLHTRREFLRKGLTVAAVGVTVPTFLTRTAFALNNPADMPLVSSRPGIPDDRILVVLQMAGGNDGLNTLVPFTNDDYYRARPALAVPRDQVLRINDTIGLHPALTGLKSLYDEGRMAVVQGVGYPNPDRSHFRSMEIWETASDGDRMQRYGWIGRYFDNACAGEPKPTLGIALGSSEPVTFRNTRQVGVTLQNPNQYRWAAGDAMEGPEAERQTFRKLNAAAPSAAPLVGKPGAADATLDFLQRTALNAQVSSDQIREAAARHRPAATYPNNGPLGPSLRLIAALIAGGLGSRVYYASIGGFDTHANQRGQHQQLLTQLGTTVQAFYQDLKAQGNAEKVLVMTFSEFGRRVAENASGGTDHGTAAPMFLFGPPVRPGLYGQQPSLTDLERGDLKFNTDFRSVYATVLEKWLGADPARVLGAKFPLLDCV
jgi:uncharacterized protein (DUF1501 family)